MSGVGGVQAACQHHASTAAGDDMNIYKVVHVVTI